MVLLSCINIDFLGGIIPESPDTKLAKMRWTSVSSAFSTCFKKIPDLLYLTILTLDL